MSQKQLIRLVAIGQATEAGVLPQMERHLERMREEYRGVSAVSDAEKGAYLLALSLFVAEVQEEL